MLVFHAPCGRVSPAHARPVGFYAPHSRLRKALMRPTILFLVILVGCFALGADTEPAKTPGPAETAVIVSDDPNDWPMYNRDVIGTRLQSRRKDAQQGQRREVWWRSGGSRPTIPRTRSASSTPPWWSMATSTSARRPGDLLQAHARRQAKWLYVRGQGTAADGPVCPIGLPREGFMNAALVDERHRLRRRRRRDDLRAGPSHRRGTAGRSTLAPQRSPRLIRPTASSPRRSSPTAMSWSRAAASSISWRRIPQYLLHGPRLRRGLRAGHRQGRLEIRRRPRAQAVRPAGQDQGQLGQARLPFRPVHQFGVVHAFLRRREPVRSSSAPTRTTPRGSRRRTTRGCTRTFLRRDRRRCPDGQEEVGHADQPRRRLELRHARLRPEHGPLQGPVDRRHAQALHDPRGRQADAASSASAARTAGSTSSTPPPASFLHHTPSTPARRRSAPTPTPTAHLALPGAIGGLQTGCATDGKAIYTNGIDSSGSATPQRPSNALPADRRPGGVDQPGHARGELAARTAEGQGRGRHEGQAGLHRRRRPGRLGDRPGQRRRLFHDDGEQQARRPGHRDAAKY